MVPPELAWESGIVLHTGAVRIKIYSLFDTAGITYTHKTTMEPGLGERASLCT